eukprot:TRINITY_DN693_c0_g2_i1.p1 TRINITY_DN693_c0_g2~~TRINITY_DN693_c0_g2_i1.p1  ORF type:complete len:136 (-),score=7.90 TRINITY_DN693_c0_g2_i1:405-812(-)
MEIVEWITHISSLELVPFLLRRNSDVFLNKVEFLQKKWLSHRPQRALRISKHIREKWRGLWLLKDEDKLAITKMLGKIATPIRQSIYNNFAGAASKVWKASAERISNSMLIHLKKIHEGNADRMRSLNKDREGVI